MTLLMRFSPFISQFEPWPVTDDGENLLFCSSREIAGKKYKLMPLSENEVDICRRKP